MSYREEIERMTWSFSRVTTYDQCPYEWYLHYILKDADEYPEEQNFYAQIGGYVHEILAMVLENKLKAEDAFDYYVDHYDENVTETTFPNVMDNTFDKCADYLMDADKLNSLKNDFEIVGVEKKAVFTINGKKFLGFIDVLAKSKEDGGYIVIDHKSAEYPFTKSGNIKSSARSFEKYKRQLYLYAHWVKEQYGEFPKLLVWNHFKDGGQLAIIKFDINEYQEAINWFCDKINVIEADEEFDANKEYFYCNNLCPYRNTCEYKDEEE